MKKRLQTSPPNAQPATSGGFATLRFAVLPYINVASDVCFGPYRLWKNTPENWLSQLGTDETDFTRIYRNKRGNEMGPQASILSRHDTVEPSYSHWLDAVVALSSAAWLTDPRQGDADPWTFEAWALRPGERSFLRVSKFAENFTDAQHDRFYLTTPNQTDASPASFEHAM